MNETNEPPISTDRAAELLSAAREQKERTLDELRRSLHSEQDEISTATEAVDDSRVIDDEAVDEALDARLRIELEAIERAEGRLRDGSYGFSVESGETIPAQRLEAIPWAERTKDEEQR